MTAERVEQAAGRLATAAVRRMADETDWFDELSAEHRSWVGLVAQAGIASFVDWLRDRPSAAPEHVFAAAPRELARAVSLSQAVALVRITVDTVEAAVPELAEPGGEEALRLEVIRFSREVAFAAARVYAAAAEERGAWAARQQALLLDALARGETPDALRARAASLGWPPARAVVPLVGAAPEGDAERVVADAERHCRAAGAEVLAGVDGDRLVLLVAAGPDPGVVAGAFGKGAVVVGAEAPEVALAARPLAEAVAAYRAAPAWPDAPRPVAADALLPERALAGDPMAREALLATYDALGGLRETVAAYLDHAGSVEATARDAYLHPNTVRYRLRKAAEACGYAPGDARDAFALRVALALGRLAGH